MPGKNIKWTIEKIKEGFESFYNDHGCYPTATEVDQYAKLPSARQIQRKFGGLPAVRKLLKLKGQLDYTTGEHSAERARKINLRASKVNLVVSEYLENTFGKSSVYRSFSNNDDKRGNVDFYVKYMDDCFAVDIFVPKDLRSISNCLNSKLLSNKGINDDDKIIFLMMNDSIDEIKMNALMGNRKKKLKSNQSVMSFNQLKKFCNLKGRAKS